MTFSTSHIEPSSFNGKHWSISKLANQGMLAKHQKTMYHCSESLINKQMGLKLIYHKIDKEVEKQGEN